MSIVLPLWLSAPLALMLGAIVGSFLAVILIRWPKDESAIGGRSRCDRCGVRLTAAQLIPILSFALQKGRCRKCGAPIDRRHIAIELAAAGVALIAVMAHPLPLALVSALLGWWLLLIAALDLEHHWLPDRLTLPLIPLGLIAAWIGFGPGVGDRAIGAVAGFTVLFVIAWMYRRLRGRDGMGGGDPVLLAAIGAWVGILQLPYILLGAGLLGIAAVMLMLMRGEAVTATSRLPLGTLMAIAAWPVWLIVATTPMLSLWPCSGC